MINEEIISELRAKASSSLSSAAALLEDAIRCDEEGQISRDKAMRLTMRADQYMRVVALCEAAK